MSKHTHQSFKNFVIGLVEKNKLSLDQLSKLFGATAAKRLLNADNEKSPVNPRAKNIVVEEGTRKPF